MITQAARLIVVVAFSRADNDALVQTYDPMQFDTPEEAVRMAWCLTGKCAGVLAWSREVQPDIAAYGPPTVLFQYGEVPEMECT